MKRRHLLMLLGGVTLAGAARLGCFRLARPGSPSGPLSRRARVLIERAWGGLDPKRVLDAHVHIVGLGAGGTGCWVNEKMQRYFAYPLQYARFSIYRTAAGIEDDARGDQQYVERLLSLIRQGPAHGRALIMAFDQVHDEEGKAQAELSELFTPNDYVLRLAKEHPDAFVPCASIHPYRRDAVSALEEAVRGGAVAVKWLPNAMRMDPSSPKCDAFYQKLAELQVPLITHAGEEKAVHAEEAQRFGNPLHLRRALDVGVKVVVAHCASLGQNPDLDAEVKEGEARPWVDNFELFLRLMGEKKYEGQLFGDLSALPQFNRVGRPLTEMLKRPDLQARAINGSDYPLPAVNVLMQTSTLESQGYLNAPEREALNEIDQHNPLLFDFVMKRTLKVKEGKVEHRFGPQAFMTRPELFSRLG
ncbi:MAG: amidohydrolase family protein [Myxococcota bacterium]